MSSVSLYSLFFKKKPITLNPFEQENIKNLKKVIPFNLIQQSFISEHDLNNESLLLISDMFVSTSTPFEVLSLDVEFIRKIRISMQFLLVIFNSFVDA